MNKADKRCATRSGHAEWLVLRAHEEGKRSRPWSDCYGNRAFTSDVEEARRLFTETCGKQTTAEVCQ